MDNETRDIIALLDILYGMVSEAWSMPVGNGKCIIEKDKAIEIISEIKNSLPGTVAEANRLVAARDEFIGNAKREAEAMRKSAEERAKAMVEEQEIVQRARTESELIIAEAESKSQTLRRMAGEYVNELMNNCTNQLNEALSVIKQSHGAFNSQMRAASTTAAPAEPISRTSTISRIDDDED